MSFCLRVAVGIIYLVVLSVPIVWAEQSGLERTCVLKESDGVLRVECTDGAIFSFEDPIAIVDPATGHFNPDCSYRAVLKPSNSDAGVRKQESKDAMNRRLITEDLFRLANGEQPKCFGESAVGEKRKREKEEEKLKSAIDFFNPGDSESFKGLGRFNPPAQCMDPQVHFKASEPFVQRKPKPTPSPTPSPTPAPTPDPVLSDPKKYIQVTKPVPDKRSRPKSEKRLALIEESKRYGIEPPPPATAQNPNRATTVTGAILAATKPKVKDLQKQLEICFAIDSSGSMEDDVKEVEKTVAKLEAGWKEQFPGGVKIRIIEFAQSSMDRIELREKFKNGKVVDLKRYAEEFKTGDGIEPKAAAVFECANGLSNYTKDAADQKIERHVIVISDEEGDDVKGAPTPELARATVDAKHAQFTSIDPDELPVDPFQFDASVGTQFKTSKYSKFIPGKDGIFTRVKTSSGELAWKDEDTGKLWFDAVKNHVNYQQAQDFCGNGKRPPTKEEFEEAEENGIRDLLQDMKRGSFWSSSVHPVNEYSAYDLTGDVGYVGLNVRWLNWGSVRCVNDSK